MFAVLLAVHVTSSFRYQLSELLFRDGLSVAWNASSEYTLSPGVASPTVFPHRVTEAKL